MLLVAKTFCFESVKVGCSISYWFTEGGTGCYRNRNLLHTFVERGEDVNCFSQLAMFHGALPNPDFPR